MISDIGGPTANMYEMRCSRPEVEANCRRLSCVHPTICKLLGTDHGPLVELMRQARNEPGVQQGASGLGHSHGSCPPRVPNTCASWPTHHVGGHLKVAPEHTDPDVLATDEETRASTTSSSSIGEFQQAIRKPPARSNIWCPISSPAIRAAIWTR